MMNCDMANTRARLRKYQNTDASGMISFPVAIPLTPVASPPPVVVWGEIFARSEESGSGQVYYWQGVRMEYVFQKQNVETFAPDIDQAGF